MAWRVARSLDQLLHQINEAAPLRAKDADGALGDTAHQARKSDHNPDAGGVVRARDFTHDPGRGADMHRIAEALRLSRDPRIKYVIWDADDPTGMFSSYTSTLGVPPFTWRAYTGANLHTSHMHVSVVADGRADDTTPWQLGMENPEMSLLPIKMGDGTASHPENTTDVALLQYRLNRLLAAGDRITVDGIYGEATRIAVVKAFGLPGTGASDQRGEVITAGLWNRLSNAVVDSRIDQRIADLVLQGGVSETALRQAIANHESSVDAHPHDHTTPSGRTSGPQR